MSARALAKEMCQDFVDRRSAWSALCDIFDVSARLMNSEHHKVRVVGAMVDDRADALYEEIEARFGGRD